MTTRRFGGGVVFWTMMAGASSGSAAAATRDTSSVPGVVIFHAPASSGKYVGSPGIAVLPNGDYLAKCDEFGPKSTEDTAAVTKVFRSTDRGKTWAHLTDVKPLFWATVFVHRGDAYLMGTSKGGGATVIMRSRDGGKTWTAPKDDTSGLLLGDGTYHCAPVPIVIHAGRIWRAMEDTMGPGGWGHHFRAFMMSAPVEADLLRADSWTCSERIGRNPAWLDGKFNGWLEGNAVLSPEGRIVNILRVDRRPEGGKAAVIRVSPDGKRATFDPEKDFFDFPGGAKKFTIRHDPRTGRYWSLSNPVLPRHAGPYAGGTRNTLALISSRDLRKWTIKCILLYHPDRAKHGFQYVDWLFEGEDMIVASRTAYDDGLGGAHNAHDANFLTFHRVENFRKLRMKDSVKIPPVEIGRATLDRWSAPYRGWHYHDDHVIPAKPRIKGFEQFESTDCPTVFQLPGDDKWYMSFIGFDGQGYNSFVAESNDLVDWQNFRLAMGFGPEGGFDHGGCVLGAYLYESYDIKAPRLLKRRDGKFWSLYGAYPRQGGYELRPGYEGLAGSEDGLTWRRAKDNYTMSVHDKDCSAWEKDCIYQPWLVEHEGRFFDFYNAARGSVEQTGLALSDNLFDWRRHDANPILRNSAGGYDETFCSDPKVFRDGDHWTMFYFGVGRGGAHVMIAFSRDLLHWTKHPEPLYRAGGHPDGLDKTYAHKISLVYDPKNETFYMFYCAVGDKGRGIGLITSSPLGRAKRQATGQTT